MLFFLLAIDSLIFRNYVIISTFKLVVSKRPLGVLYSFLIFWICLIFTGVLLLKLLHLCFPSIPGHFPLFSLNFSCWFLLLTWLLNLISLHCMASSSCCCCILRWLTSSSIITFLGLRFTHNSACSFKRIHSLSYSSSLGSC